LRGTGRPARAEADAEDGRAAGLEQGSPVHEAVILAPTGAGLYIRAGTGAAAGASAIGSP
jgi:hypothetical protein